MAAGWIMNVPEPVIPPAEKYQSFFLAGIAAQGCRGGGGGGLPRVRSPLA
jgi:hypothetical protein